MEILFKSIGTIRTPYREIAPFRPDPDAKGEFRIIVDQDYSDALRDVGSHKRIIVYFFFDRSQKTNLIVHPPHLNGRTTGLFSSRSPNRINKIGMDIVQVLKVEKNVIHTSPMDILDNTPLLDIKPYIKDLDCFTDH